jgi:hypothetical protein
MGRSESSGGSSEREGNRSRAVIVASAKVAMSPFAPRKATMLAQFPVSGLWSVKDYARSVKENLAFGGSCFCYSPANEVGKTGINSLPVKASAFAERG